ncbi:MAG: N-acetylneuraminate synthase [Minisyncoccia bacterium]|jgi:N,N'-diacetyllegionaminate synthase
MITVKIGKSEIGYSWPVFFIAEAGVNHNGRLDLALKLVDAAADAGANAVKFQTWKAEQVVTGGGEMAEYQKKNTGKTESQLEMLKEIELDERFYDSIVARCKKRNIIFLSTPHGHIKSADFLHKLGVPAFKIGSGDLTNQPFLEHIAKFRKPMIVSTGMATLKEIKDAMKWIKRAGNDKIVFLHCTTNYPCPFEGVNLGAMQTMMKALPSVLVGYSDHTEGSLVSTMAVALGACVIEKHLTLNKNTEGPDHKASSNPEELRIAIQAIRNIPIIMGRNIKQPVPSEKKIALITRKSIVSLRPIKRGERFTEKNLGIKRPGNGVSPRYYQSLLGKLAKKDIKNDSLIQSGDW